MKNWKKYALASASVIALGATLACLWKPYR